jgi:hypothetical protein
MPRKLVKIDAEIGPLTDRLCAAVIASSHIIDPDTVALAKELRWRRRPRPPGPKIKQLRLDRHPPRNRTEAKKWIEARLKRLAREAGLLRLPSDLKRRWVGQLIAEVKRTLPAVRLTVDEFMRQHIRTS